MYTTCSELGIFMYWTGDSLNNLLSYSGLVEVSINASEKDLPVNKSRLNLILIGQFLKIENLFLLTEQETSILQCIFRGDN